MNNVVIVGGGTAGWLTALYIQKVFPKSYIKVIASSEIGILGAGEGTTADFTGFLKFLDVPISGVIQYAHGTIKIGNMFNNWNGDGKSYFHPFLDTPYMDDVNAYYNEIYNGNNLNDVQLSSIAAFQHKVLYKKDTLEKIGSDGLHFDAALLAKYLEKISIERGIILVDAKMTNVITDHNGFITKILLDGLDDIETDFVFDCTGFKRLIIGNFYGSKWQSYNDSLPVNRAMPFFISNEGEKLPPYSQSTSMKNGWMWKNPVQGRYGCGYVFDSNFATDEEIKAEAEEYLGQEITVPKMFSFNAGCFNDIWINNCVAVGLSGGFIEPLEATSIWVATQTLKTLKIKEAGIFQRDQQAISQFNSIIRNMNAEIVSFIHFHYLSKRNDTEFWRNFKKNNSSPAIMQAFQDISNRTLPSQRDIDYINTVFGFTDDPNYIRTFEIANWHTVGAGLKFFKSNFDITSINKSDYIASLLSKSQELIDHMEYLEILRNAS